MDGAGRRLLESFVPPEPASDWKACVRVLERERAFLLTVFRYYSSLTDSVFYIKWPLFCHFFTQNRCMLSDLC